MKFTNTYCVELAKTNSKGVLCMKRLVLRRSYTAINHFYTDMADVQVFDETCAQLAGQIFIPIRNTIKQEIYK